MFQDNPLLNQLKQQIQEAKPKKEGVVRATEKAYGFLECDGESFFLTPQAMKKLMHGDKILASIETINDKFQAEPLKLLEPRLDIFVACVQFNKNKRLQLKVDNPQIHQVLNARVNSNITKELSDGDWVMAKLTQHPLRDDKFWQAEVTQFICKGEDNFAPWWVTLAKHHQSRYPVQGLESYTAEACLRADLTHLPFVTIDSKTTLDMDDALYIENTKEGWQLYVAVADPTAYIPVDSELDKEASLRCFTNYLPSFNIPMLPRELADNLCSLTPLEEKLALVGKFVVNSEGNLVGETEFLLAKIKSHAKLAYDEVSDYLDLGKQSLWQPENAVIVEQIHLLQKFTQARINWRKTNALLFNESADYEFVVNEVGKVLDIQVKQRRIANKIVEEAMILANECAGDFLQRHNLAGVFNCHSGFDNKFITLASEFLRTQMAEFFSPEELKARYSVENLKTLAGYCQMRRDIEKLAFDRHEYLEMRLRRFLGFAEFKSTSAPHFGLGLSSYATWTSPIRKYNDILNHRAIKACLTNQTSAPITEEQLQRLQEARRLNRLVERDIADWLYSEYLANKVGEQHIFEAQVRDINRSGIRVQLTANGAVVFIPASSITEKREDYCVKNDELALYVQDKLTYKIGDYLKVQLSDVNLEHRLIIGKVWLENAEN